MAQWGLMVLTKILGVSIILSTGCAYNGREGRNNVMINTSGAAAIDPVLSTEALIQAKSMGVSVDVLEVVKSVKSDGTQIVTSELILFGDTKFPVYTEHRNPTFATGSARLGDLNLQINGYCSNSNCDPYFLMIDVLKEGRRAIQIGQITYFNGQRANYFQWNIPDRWMDFSSMIQVLLTGQ